MSANVSYPGGMTSIQPYILNLSLHLVSRYVTVISNGNYNFVIQQLG